MSPSLISKSGNGKKFHAAEEDETTSYCGWMCFRPAVLQPCTSFWTFIILYLIFSFTHGVQGSYTVAVLTTLEKRFHLSSSMSGMLVTVSTIGYVFSSVFVSYYFAKKHQPRLFAGCMLLTGCCALLYVIPHFIYGTGNDVIDSLGDGSSLIPSSKTNSSSDEMGELCSEGYNGSYVDVECSMAQKQSADEGLDPILPAVALFCMSEILQGVAGASLWTVGLAYMDDNTPAALSSKLIGIMFLMRFFSPMLSFALGSYLLTLYANLQDSVLTPEHPQWVGAWWLGYLVCSIINLCLFIPTSMLPKTLRKISDTRVHVAKISGGSNNEVNCDVNDDANGKVSVELDLENTSVKELLNAIGRLLRNPIYTTSSIAICIDCYILAFVTFLPKYFEVNFQQTAWMANLLGGMIPVVSGGIMSYVGGVLSGRFMKSMDGGVAGNAGMTCLSSVVSVIILIPLMLISSSYQTFGGHMQNNRLNFTLDCNLECGCSSDAMFDPVCGTDGQLYYSPCFAGCSDFEERYDAKQIAYTNCQCIPDGLAYGGLCSNHSDYIAMTLYVLVSIALFCFINSYNVPITNVLLRCVDVRDKSLGLGIQTLAVCLVIFPAPLLYGSVIDSTCLLHKTVSCTESEGTCLLYDRDSFRLKFHGLTIGLRFVSSTLYFISYMIAKRKLRTLETLETSRIQRSMAPPANKNGQTLLTQAHEETYL